MALLYFKYRTDYGNAIIDSSVSPFTLGANEAQIQIDYTIPANQPYYLYRYVDPNIVTNSEDNISNYESDVLNIPTGTYVLTSTFTAVTNTLQTKIIFNENTTPLNTLPAEFNEVRFTSGITAINQGNSVLDVRVIYGSEVYTKENNIPLNNTTATMLVYDTISPILAGGTYRIEYQAQYSMSVANRDIHIEWRSNGVDLSTATFNDRLASSTNQRITQANFIRTYPAGSRSFSIAFATSGSGTATIFNTLIIITRIS